MPVWPPLRPPPNSFGEDLVLGCGRRGTCGALPDRPRRQMASRHAHHHLHPQAVPQRHSNVSPRGWPDGRFGNTILLRAPPQRNPHINSVRATVPHVPSGQPSVVVLTTADPPISKLEPQHPPPLPPKHHRHESKFVFLHLHSSFTGLPGSPNRIRALRTAHQGGYYQQPPSAALKPTPTVPGAPAHPPCPPMLSKDDTPVPAVSCSLSSLL